MKNYELTVNLLVGTKVIPKGTKFNEENVPDSVLAEVDAKTASVKVTDTKAVAAKVVQIPLALTDAEKKTITAAKAKLTKATNAAKEAREAAEAAAGIANSASADEKEEADELAEDAGKTADALLVKQEEAETALAELIKE